MSCDAKDGQITESTRTPADPLEAGQSAALGKGHDIPAESGIVEEFCKQRIRNAMNVFQEIVAEDYAQFMSQQTGIHADYFRL